MKNGQNKCIKIILSKGKQKNVQEYLQHFKKSDTTF